MKRDLGGKAGGWIGAVWDGGSEDGPEVDGVHIGQCWCVKNDRGHYHDKRWLHYRAE